MQHFDRPGSEIIIAHTKSLKKLYTLFLLDAIKLPEQKNRYVEAFEKNGLAVMTMLQ